MKKSSFTLIRALKIASVISKYFVFHRINLHKRKSLGKRLREACEELGPTFIKLGQILSVRYDILSANDCKELQKLLDDVRPISYPKIKEIFLHDFGKEPEEIFANFDKKPIASASIAQVYKAELKTGEIVAVKVRKPYIGEIIEKDMKIIKLVSYIAQIFSPTLRHLQAHKIADELNGWMLQEIDFEKEAKGIDALREYSISFSAGKLQNIFSKVHYLNTYHSYNSKNILTINFVEGIPLNKIHLVKNNPDYDVLQSLKNGIKSITATFALSKTHMTLHADPHPANIIIQKNGHITFIDCGLVAKIEKEHLAKMRKLLLAVYSQDVDGAVKNALIMCNVSYKKYHKRIRKDIIAYLEHTKDSSLGYWFMGMVSIFIKHKIPVPYFLSSFGRAAIVFEGAILSYDPAYNSADILRDILKYALHQEIIDNIKDIKYEGLLYSMSTKLKESPELLNSFINRYYDLPDQFLFDVNKIVKAFKGEI